MVPTTAMDTIIRLLLLIFNKVYDELLFITMVLNRIAI